MEVNKFEDWLHNSKVGDRVTYAVGTTDELAKGIAKAAAHAYKMGMVELFQRKGMALPDHPQARHPERARVHVYDYMAVRVSKMTSGRLKAHYG